MWTYDRKNHVFSKGPTRFTECYSGHGEGLNNPDMEDVHDIGPLPAGLYHMSGFLDLQGTGKGTIILTPDKNNNMFGRSRFRIHGDNISNNFSASHGCIVLPGMINRVHVWESEDHDLQVV